MRAAAAVRGRIRPLGSPAVAGHGGLRRGRPDSLTHGTMCLAFLGPEGSAHPEKVRFEERRAAGRDLDKDGNAPIADSDGSPPIAMVTARLISALESLSLVTVERTLTMVSGPVGAGVVTTVPHGVM